MTSQSPITEPRPKPRRGRQRRAVSPRLRKLLDVVFGLFALLAVNSTYLVGVSLLEWARGETYQNWFYLVMFLGHLALGLLIIVPVLVFLVAGGVELGQFVLLNQKTPRAATTVADGGEDEPSFGLREEFLDRYFVKHAMRLPSPGCASRRARSPRAPPRPGSRPRSRPEPFRRGVPDPHQHMILIINMILIISIKSHS